MPSLSHGIHLLGLKSSHNLLNVVGNLETILITMLITSKQKCGWYFTVKL